VLALSAAASTAHAQATPPQLPATMPSTWSVWVEGSPSWTGGGSFNIPSLPGFSAPYAAFNPPLGFEFAVGADYQPLGQPYHYIFDFRYGQSGTGTSTSAGSSASSSTNFVLTGFVPPFAGPPLAGTPLGTTTTQNTSTSFFTQASEREDHLVADLLIGRDMGVGANKPVLEFGIRFADLHAAAQALLSGQSASNINSLTTFYTDIRGIQTRTSGSTAASAFSAFASWNSRFFGVGPRLAVGGGVPIAGSWSFEYSGGIAELLGNRSFNMSMWSTTGVALSGLYNSNVFVFNADGSFAVSYAFTPAIKASLGIRADYYNSALTTFNVGTGALGSLDRVYWGPFVRLTGSFNP
jgi:hypothetical protein